MYLKTTKRKWKSQKVTFTIYIIQEWLEQNKRIIKEIEKTLILDQQRKALVYREKLTLIITMNQGGLIKNRIVNLNKETFCKNTQTIFIHNNILIKIN